MTARAATALLAAVLLTLLVVMAAVQGVQGAVSSMFGTSSPSPSALADIPAVYLATARTGRCPRFLTTPRPRNCCTPRAISPSCSSAW